MSASPNISTPTSTNEIPYRFIVVEGADGSGKTTLSRRLQESIPNSLWTCETSHGTVGQLIRQILAKKQEPLDRFTMAALFTADRLDHLHRVIRPALETGKRVICDRYYYSTYIYQQLYKEHALMLFNAMSSHPILKPDLTLVIDVDPSVASDRRKHRRGDASLFEDKKTQREVCAQYSSLKARFPNDWIIRIDGNQSAENVYNDAVAALYRLPPTLPANRLSRR